MRILALVLLAACLAAADPQPTELLEIPPAWQGVWKAYETLDENGESVVLNPPEAIGRATANSLTFVALGRIVPKSIELHVPEEEEKVPWVSLVCDKVIFEIFTFDATNVVKAHFPQDDGSVSTLTWAVSIIQ